MGEAHRAVVHIALILSALAIMLSSMLLRL
jgi:hypothetical protein